jgi:NHLM bacteriocin system ABC transporter ATP-binding protein
LSGQADMATIALKLEELGSLQSPVSNRPFSIQDPSSIWIVQSGKLDLFLTVSRNKQVGARHHLLRIEEGHAVFGFAEVDNDIRLMASALPGTKLLWLSQSRLREITAVGEAKEDAILSYLEDWISALSVLLPGNVGSPTFLTLEAGGNLALHDKPRAVAPKEGILWVTHRKGSSRFLGNTDAPPVEGTGFFPVSRRGWLETAAGSVLYAVPSDTLHRENPGSRDLTEFHRNAMFCLIQELHLAEQKERIQFETRSTSDAALMDRALLQLAAPLLATPEVDLGDENFVDPLLMACQVVGNKLAIKMKPHPDMRHAVKPKNPVTLIAKASNVRVRRVALRGAWWEEDSGPMLVFGDKDNRPMALLPPSPGTYDLYDPAKRQTIRVNAEVAVSLNPFGYIFYRPFPARKLGVLDLLRFGVQGCEGELLTILMVGGAVGVLGIVTPFGTGIIFDSIIPGAERNQLVRMSLFLLMCAISSALFALAQTFATLRLEGKMDAAIQAAVWDRLLSLPVPFFRQYSSGDLAMRSLGIIQIRRALTGSTLTSVVSGVFSIFSFALLFYYRWKLAILATVLVAVAFLISTAVGYWQVRYQRQVVTASGYISNMVLQLISGIAKVRVAGAEGRAFAAWAREFAQQKQRSLRSRRLSNSLTVFTSVFPVICLAGIFYYNAYLTAQPNAKPFSTGHFLAFLVAFIQFLMATLMMSSSMVSVLNVVPLYERAKPIFSTLPEVSAAKTSPGKLNGAVEVSHVTFRYRQDTPLVLHDLSVSIRPGEFVAFVGPSGSGKSTLFRLLLGFETPESGSIYYDGQDLTGLDVQEVRREMGVVLQNGRLFTGDIFTNIVGSAALTLEDAWEAARLAGIDGDIRRMPMGMHTLISEGGGGISGGQRQRMLIARAIVGRPRVLLFDEATSALDNKTQDIVSRSLESLQATRIVIAHRLNTVINADRIFVLDKGTLVQNGTFQELMAQEGLFQELARRQLT